MNLEEVYQQHPARGIEGYGRFSDASFRQSMVQRFRSCSDADESWLLTALDDDERKWFAAALLDAVGIASQSLVSAMIRAAVYEKNPSFNRVFIEPVAHKSGHRFVILALFEFLEHGTNAEKAGAARALYWAWPRDSANGLNDLVLRQRILKLREFVRNEDLEVRRYIVPGLNLQTDSYPAEYAALVHEAISIGRNHSDEYIRHRTGIQLGEGGPFQPLPKTP